MKRTQQTLSEILSSLQPLQVDWQDDVALRVIDYLQTIPSKKKYTRPDIKRILNHNFDDALLIFRLFLGLSKDQFVPMLKSALGGGGCGIKRYQQDQDAYIQALISLEVPQAMAACINRAPHWSDILVERLRSGRGSAISGMKRGRNVEDFVEAIVKKIFKTYDIRCDFSGISGKKAKCDFAIPGRDLPKIIIESKGYAATGSKMTDIIGDLEKIMIAKRHDTKLLFFTDGLSWNQRQSDLAKIIKFQNEGYIERIYTLKMAEQFEEDLRSLKVEFGLE
jgi:uncharacterized protein YihD (DUF1040 family)